MHQILAAIFTMILSLCQHTAMRPMQASFNSNAPEQMLSFPSRQDLAHGGFGAAMSAGGLSSGYAGTACLSCQTMSVAYIGR